MSMFFFTSLSPPDIRVHIVGSQLKTLENTFKTCGTATTTFCMGVEQSIGKAILHFMAEVQTYTIGCKITQFCSRHDCLCLGVIAIYHMVFIVAKFALGVGGGVPSN